MILIRDKYLLSLIFLIFLYLCLRTFMVGITFDEALTLINYATKPLNIIISCTPCDANNHILNSLLTKYTFRIGFTEFWARLPNLTAGIIYLIFTYKLSTEFFKKNVFRYSLFLLLALNPFLLEFFGLTRGYGLALAFTLSSLYYLLRFKVDQKRQYLRYVLILSALSVLSNFTFLNYFLSILILLSIIIIERRFSVKSFLFNTIVVIIPLTGLIWTPFLKLLKGGNFYFGGEIGVFHDSLFSLTRAILYTPYEYETSALILKLFLIVCGFILFFRIISIQSLRRYLLSEENLLLFLAILPIMANVLQHHLFGTKYFAERTAIFYYPLIIIALHFLAASVKPGWMRFSACILLMIVTLSMTFNFIRNINFYKTVSWFFDAHTEEVLTYIKEEGEGKKKMTLASEWPFRSSIAYYQKYKNYENIFYDLDQMHSNTISSDYFLHLGKDIPEYNYFAKDQAVLKMKYDTIRSWPEEDVYLFKMKN